MQENVGKILIKKSYGNLFGLFFQFMSDVFEIKIDHNFANIWIADGKITELQNLVVWIFLREFKRNFDISSLLKKVKKHLETRFYTYTEN